MKIIRIVLWIIAAAIVITGITLIIIGQLPDAPSGGDICTGDSCKPGA